jgi:hypothetical protein
MEKNYESISIKTVEEKIVDGNALIYGKSRVSELFTDNSIYFIVMEETIDDLGTRRDKLFINKDLVIWVEPKDVKQTTQKAYLDNIRYIEISIKTVEGVIVDGKVNLQAFGSLDDMLRYTSPAPFVILIDAHDSKGNFHHTLFVNKKSIIQIEGRLQL